MNYFNNGFYLFVLMVVVGIASSLVKCPNCKKCVSLTKKGWSTPFVFKHCDKCNQSLLKCEIDEELKNKED